MDDDLQREPQQRRKKSQAIARPALQIYRPPGLRNANSNPLKNSNCDSSSNGGIQSDQKNQMTYGGENEIKKPTLAAGSKQSSKIDNNKIKNNSNSYNTAKIDVKSNVKSSKKDERPKTTSPCGTNYIKNTSTNGKEITSYPSPTRSQSVPQNQIMSPKITTVEMYPIKNMESTIENVPRLKEKAQKIPDSNETEKLKKAEKILNANENGQNVPIKNGDEIDEQENNDVAPVTISTENCDLLMQNKVPDGQNMQEITKIWPLANNSSKIVKNIGEQDSTSEKTDNTLKLGHQCKSAASLANQNIDRTNPYFAINKDYVVQMTKKKSPSPKDIEDMKRTIVSLNIKQADGLHRFLQANFHSTNERDAIEAADRLARYAIEECPGPGPNNPGRPDSIYNHRSRSGGESCPGYPGQNGAKPPSLAKVCSILVVENGAFDRAMTGTLRGYFECRDRLRGERPRVWMAYLTFLADLYGNVVAGAYEGQLVDVLFRIFNYMLTGPVLDTLKIEELECLISSLLSVGYDLERQCPDRLGALKDTVRDALVSAREPWARKMILLLMELSAGGWKLPVEANEYYFQPTSAH